MKIQMLKIQMSFFDNVSPLKLAASESDSDFEKTSSRKLRVEGGDHRWYLLSPCKNAQIEKRKS